MSLYIYAGIAIVILFLISSIVRWWNLPSVIAKRNESIEARSKAQNDRREDRLKLIETRNRLRRERQEQRKKPRDERNI